MRGFELWIDDTQVPAADMVGCELIVETEQIDVTPATERDPRWEWLDAAGHWHGAAVGKDGQVWYPTLKTVTREADCDECGGTGRGPWSEYMNDYESCEECGGSGERGDSYPGCAICGERAALGMRAPVGRVYGPGRTSWRVEARLRGETAGWWVKRAGANLEGSVVVRTRGKRGDDWGPWWFGVAQLHVPEHGDGSESGYWADLVLHGVGEVGQRVG